MHFAVVATAVAALAALAAGRALTQSMPSISTYISRVGGSDTIDDSQSVNYPSPSDQVQTAGYFDPKNAADNNMWTEYIKKGEHMKCIMEATDAGAGFLVEDTRKPPSAASPWTGDLKGRFPSADYCIRKHRAHAAQQNI
tara:strand:+ start:2785 stop:3204 length:420 start_codon:yes stop_codon:yes gene_type:complete